jgi:hypothetical protein
MVAGVAAALLAAACGQTRVVFLFGTQDASEAPTHGRVFVTKLRGAGSSKVSVQVVSGMGHLVSASTAGLDAPKAALTG